MKMRTVLLLLIGLIIVKACDSVNNLPAVDCSRHGSNTIFLTNFDSEVVGNMPTSSNPLH